MPMRLKVAAGEQLVVSGYKIEFETSSVITLLSSNTPILREKEYIDPERAFTLCERLRVLVQSIYFRGLEKADSALLMHYMQAAMQIDVRLIDYVIIIQSALTDGRYYAAVKAARILCDKEYEFALIAADKEKRNNAVAH